MKTLLPHIRIGKNQTGRVILQIDDYELLDFIVDYLVERFSISYETIDEQNNSNGRIFTIEFPIEITIEKIELCLSDLSYSVIEKIYDINN